MRPPVPLLLALLLAACASAPPAPAEEADPAEAGEPEAAATAEVEDDGGLQQQSVTLYFPAADGDGLVPEKSRIFYTASPVDRAKQIVADLLAGPNADGSVAALPDSARLRQIYLLEGGTAWADFSGALRNGLRGGSTSELLAVYAIVNSLTENVDEIRRVGILIDGRSVVSLNGHLDLSRPLPPNRGWIHNAQVVRLIDRP